MSGDHEAIAQIDHELGGYKNAGVVTYILWRSVYMSKLLSVRNRYRIFKAKFPSDVPLRPDSLWRLIGSRRWFSDATLAEVDSVKIVKINMAVVSEVWRKFLAILLE